MLYLYLNNYITLWFQVSESKIFERDGVNVSSTVTISFTQVTCLVTVWQVMTAFLFGGWFVCLSVCLFACLRGLKKNNINLCQDVVESCSKRGASKPGMEMSMGCACSISMNICTGMHTSGKAWN